MKFCVVPNDTKNLDKYKKIGADAFIFGLKDMCSGYDSISLDEIKEITLENSVSEIFFLVFCRKSCSFRKKHYLCTRNQEQECLLISLPRWRNR